MFARSEDMAWHFARRERESWTLRRFELVRSTSWTPPCEMGLGCRLGFEFGNKPRKLLARDNFGICGIWFFAKRLPLQASLELAMLLCALKLAHREPAILQNVMIQGCFGSFRVTFFLEQSGC